MVLYPIKKKSLSFNDFLIYTKVLWFSLWRGCRHEIYMLSISWHIYLFGAMCFTFTNESYSATGIKNIYNCLVMLLFEMSLTLVYCIADYGIKNPITSDKLMLYNFNKRDDYSSNVIYHFTYMALCSQEYHHHFRHKSKDDHFSKRIRETYIYSISQEICTRFCCALLCCGYAIVHNEFTWSIYPYSSGLLCWHWSNR